MLLFLALRTRTPAIPGPGSTHTTSTPGVGTASQEGRTIGPGDEVYHVANPDVRGVVRGGVDAGGWVPVLFDIPVGFSGNEARGLARDWVCSAKYLHPTSAEAWRHKRY